MKLKGKMAIDSSVQLALAIAVAIILLAVGIELLYDAGQSAKDCGAFASWIADLSKGAAELC